MLEACDTQAFLYYKIYVSVIAGTFLNYYNN